MSSLRRVVFTAALSAVLPASASAAGDIERGRSLHDNHCLMCHKPAVYERKERVANTYPEIRQQVQRWQSNTKLNWSESDIDSVTEFLAATYYKVPE
ncbi:MAG: hypothetical protein ABI794_16995 [Betaproteobacteria bacterium]